MRALQKVRETLRGLVQRHGTESLKKMMWDREYQQGRWNCLDKMTDDYVYSLVEEHANSGSILDLGCGPGAVGDALKTAAYASYTGVDIAGPAIDQAKHRAEATGRSSQVHYYQADILTYVPERLYDVILFGDSLYYFRQTIIDELLKRYSKYLKEGGVFIVRSWVLRDRVRTMIHNIETRWDVIDKTFYHDSELVVITFRARMDGASCGT